MDVLFSGLVGAFFATILTTYYSYVSDQWKWRANILLEVVAYCDDIYDNLQNLSVMKNASYTNKKKEINHDDYRDRSNNLSTLLKTSLPGVKLALIYGDGDMLGIFNQLRAEFHAVSSILRKATSDNWEKEQEKIMLKFSQKIDPMRASFESMLLQDAREYMFKNRLHAFFSALLLWIKPSRK